MFSPGTLFLKLHSRSRPSRGVLHDYPSTLALRPFPVFGHDPYRHSSNNTRWPRVWTTPGDPPTASFKRWTPDSFDAPAPWEGGEGDKKEPTSDRTSGLVGLSGVDGDAREGTWKRSSRPSPNVHEHHLLTVARVLLHKTPLCSVAIVDTLRCCLWRQVKWIMLLSVTL